MKGQTLRLVHARARAEAHRVIDAAPDGYIVNVAEPVRSSEQNAMLWALLSDVSRAKPTGRVMSPELWKCVFMAAVGHDCQFVPSLDGSTVVPVGFRSSHLRKSQFSDLIESILAFGAEHGVEFTQDKDQAA